MKKSPERFVAGGRQPEEERETPELRRKQLENDFNKVNADLSIFVHDLARVRAVDLEVSDEGFAKLKNMLDVYGKLLEKAEKEELGGVLEVEEKGKEKNLRRRLLRQLLVKYWMEWKTLKGQSGRPVPGLSIGMQRNKRKSHREPPQDFMKKSIKH